MVQGRERSGGWPRAGSALAAVALVAALLGCATPGGEPERAGELGADAGHPAAATDAREEPPATAAAIAASDEALFDDPVVQEGEVTGPAEAGGASGPDAPSRELEGAEGAPADLDAEDEFLAESAVAVADPIEPVNRGVLRANRALEWLVLDPVTRAYGWAVPDPGKRAVRNVFSNLNRPVVLVNDLLQLEGRRAGSTLARFVVNTTLGVAGIFDPATPLGLEEHDADFGQTLGKAGLGPGIYLVVPVIGPSSARDFVGSLVDFALRPETWILPLASQLLVGGTGGLAVREASLDELDALRRSSIDYYATLRSAYLMHREAKIHETDP